MRLVVAAFCAAFALALFVLPLVRVLQHRLSARRAIGLWLAGAGFTLLAVAASGQAGTAAPAMVLGGAGLAVIGNIVQRRIVGGTGKDA